MIHVKVPAKVPAYAHLAVRSYKQKLCERAYSRLVYISLMSHHKVFILSCNGRCHLIEHTRT